MKREKELDIVGALLIVVGAFVGAYGILEGGLSSLGYKFASSMIFIGVASVAGGSALLTVMKKVI